MPCWSIVTNTVVFQAGQHQPDLVADALRALGYNVAQSGSVVSFSGHGVYGNYANGQFSTSSSGKFNVDAVKQSFGKAAVKKAAKKFGWQVTEKNGAFELRKRV